MSHINIITNEYKHTLCKKLCINGGGGERERERERERGNICNIC